MHITLEADYAVRIVEYLAISNQKESANAISENTNVPIRFALKILRKLVAADIIASYKGSKGGYILNRPANDITLRSVIEAVEGPYFISRCLNNEYSCGHMHCKFHKVYDDISKLVRDRLDEVTFGIVCK